MSAGLIVEHVITEITVHCAKCHAWLYTQKAQKPRVTLSVLLFHILQHICEDETAELPDAVSEGRG